MTVFRSQLSKLAVGAAFALCLAAGPAAAKIIIKIGHPLPPKTGLQVWAEYFKAGVEKRAGKEVEVKIFPTSLLGAIPRMIEGVQLGTIEMVTIPPGFFTGIDQRYSVLAAPGVFDGIAHGHRVVHEPEFKQAFWTIGDAKGLKMVSMSCDTPSDYATVKPIRTIADFRGRKLRVFGSKFEIETLRRLGATGVPMPLSEVIPAIQQKVIDGNKAGITVFVPFRYQTVAKYVLQSTESIICINRMVSQKWFDKLPTGVRTIVAEEAASADSRIIDFNVAVIRKMYGVWTKNGGTLTKFDPAEETKLKALLATVGETVLKDQPEVLAVYNVMKRVADRTRER